MFTMDFIVWLLPVTFILHDFEEIVMAEVWNARNSEKINTVFRKRKPFGLAYLGHYKTPALTVAVAIEFLLFSLISLLSVVFHGWFVWYGALMGLVLHYVLIHVPLCMKFKGYVPGVVTAVIMLFPCIWSLVQAGELLRYGAVNILLACLLGAVLMLIVIPVLHKLMGPLSGWLYRYAGAKGD